MPRDPGITIEFAAEDRETWERGLRILARLIARAHLEEVADVGSKDPQDSPGAVLVPPVDN
ncbi:MAG: hypothetical protein OXC99_01000 [Chloroflexi bacterium]|nr:hypothetical protein [Chloroflexota bacterium]